MYDRIHSKFLCCSDPGLDTGTHHICGTRDIRHKSSQVLIISSLLILKCTSSRVTVVTVVFFDFKLPIIQSKFYSRSKKKPSLEIFFHNL